MTETTDGGGRCGQAPAWWPQYSDTNRDLTEVLCGLNTRAANNRFCKPSEGNRSLPGRTKPSVGEPCHRRPHPLDETVRSAIVRFSLKIPTPSKAFPWNDSYQTTVSILWDQVHRTRCQRCIPIKLQQVASFENRAQRVGSMESLY
jgi:hypothetical protein